MRAEEASTLNTWGNLGKMLTEDTAVRASWGAVQRMISAAISDAKRAEHELGALLQEASLRVPGVGDPLAVSLDFGLHRWLRGSREEAYSDWLAWIVERQEDASKVAVLFGVDSRLTPCDDVTVDRELTTAQGRLDLCVRFGAQSTLVVEVKTTSSPDVEQLSRYAKWLVSQSVPIGVVVLLALEPPNDDLPENIQFCSWRHVAQELRDWSTDWLIRGRVIEAVLTLAYCGAIEQNLLGLGVLGLEALSTRTYIEDWMGRK